MPASNSVIDTILAEAGGSGLAGMAAVAHVINNRAAQRGLTPAQVVAQQGQFEGYSNPSAGGRANMSNAALRAQAEQFLIAASGIPLVQATALWLKAKDL